MSLGFTLLVERFAFTFLYCLPLRQMLSTCSQRSRCCLSEKFGSLRRQLVYQSCNETTTLYHNGNIPGNLPQPSCICKPYGKTYSISTMVEMLGHVFEETNLNSSNYWKLLSAFYNLPWKPRFPIYLSSHQGSCRCLFTPQAGLDKNDVMKAPRALYDLCIL